MMQALFEAINPCREGRQSQECLTLQHLNSWRQSWKCFVCECTAVLPTQTKSSWLNAE